ncbi:hypothetical protein D3C87_1741350 [compost metagenome]
MLAHGFVERDALVDDLCRGLVATHHFHQRDQVRRVERVANDKALGMPATGLQAAHDEARRTGRHDDMGRQHRIHAGKEVDLEVFAFGRIFLHKIHAGQRLGQVRFESQR